MSLASSGGCGGEGVGVASLGRSGKGMRMISVGGGRGGGGVYIIDLIGGAIKPVWGIVPGLLNGIIHGMIMSPGGVRRSRMAVRPICIRGPGMCM